MNPPKQHSKREEGMALLVSVIFLIVMGLSAAYIITRTITHNDQVNHHISHLDAFQGLEAANAAAVVQIARANDTSFPPEERDGFIGIDPDYDFATLGLPDFGSPGVTPVALASRPDVEFFAYSLDWANDGIDNNGDGLIDDVLEQLGFSSVIAHARVVRNGQTVVSRRSEQIIGSGAAISIWQNAIFAGTGQAGGLINGNVAIHGSVHLLGDDLDENDEAVATIEVLEMSGTSLIHNNYDGIPADLEWRVPPLPQTMVNGELVDTLFANLRVKNGLVSLSGNSEIGQVNVAGNDIKELMDGVFVTDGWTGNQVVDGDPSTCTATTAGRIRTISARAFRSRRTRTTAAGCISITTWKRTLIRRLACRKCIAAI
jgi:hypothetical protein